MKKTLLICLIGLICPRPAWAQEQTSSAQPRPAPPAVSVPTDYSGQVTFQKDNSTLSVQPLNVSSSAKSAESEGNTLMYNQVQKNTDVILQAIPNGVKESIILNSPDSPKEFSWNLNLSSNLEVRVNKKTRALGLFEKSAPQEDDNKFDPLKTSLWPKQKVFEIPAPFAVDAKNQRTDKLGVKIVNNVLTITVDPEFLKTASYPIVIDPTITYNTSSQFSNGAFNRTFDTGSGSSPSVEGYYHELPADINTAGLWHLNETADNTCSGRSNDACDSSANANNGAATGTTITTTGQKLGAAARTFNGSSDYLAKDTSVSGIGGSTAMTIEAWVKRNNDTLGNIISVGNTVNYAYIRLEVNYNSVAGSVRADFGNAADTAYSIKYTTVNSISSGEWHHVAATYDAGTVRIYIDGVEVSGTTSGSLTGAVIAPTTYLRIGNHYANGDSNYFNGSIDEIRLSNIARTPEEIKMDAQRTPYSIYTSPVIDLGTNPLSTFNSLSWSESGVNTGDGETLADATSLVAQWNFNETSNTTADNAEGTAALDGTLTGFTVTDANDCLTSQDDVTPAGCAGSGWTANNKRWGAGALMFDGTNDYVSVGTNKFEDQNTGTIEAWINIPDNGGNYAILESSQIDSDTNHLKFFINQNSDSKNHLYIQQYIGVGAGQNNTIFTDDTFDAGQWHYVAVTSDGSTWKLYIDGRQRNTTVSIGSNNGAWFNDLAVGTHTVDIGRFKRSSQELFFKGIMDSVREYSRALTAAEILSNYNTANIEFQTRTSADNSTWEEWKPTTDEAAIDAMDSTYQYNTTDTGLVDYYPMDETANDSCTGGTNDVCDRKGSNDLTTNGAPKIVDGKFSKARSFDGTSDYFTANSHANWNFGTGDFAVEFWVKFNSIGTWPSGAEGLFGTYTDGNNDVWTYTQINGSGDCSIRFGAYYNSTYIINMQPTVSANRCATGVWHHMAFTRSGNTASVYLDGIDIGDYTITNTGVNVAGGTLSIGSYDVSSSPLHGYIDEFRIYKGSAPSAATIYQHATEGISRYGLRSGGLTTSTDTVIKAEGTGSEKLVAGAPTLDGNTVGLWHMEETGGTSAYIKDATGTNDGTPTGTSVVDGFYSRGRSFNGSGDVINVSNNASLNFGTSTDFSTEAWIKATSGTSGTYIVDKNVGSGKWYLMFIAGGGNAGKLDCEAYDGTNNPTVLSTTLVNDGKWHHVACTFDRNGNITTYVDGKSENTGSMAAVGDIDVVGGLRIGANNYSGLIDEVRISNVVRTADEVAEAYRAGQDHRFGKTWSSTDLSGKTKLPFYVASDRQGTFAEATIGESAYANYESDTNTAGLWHLEENLGVGNTSPDFSGRGNNGIANGTTFIQGKIGKARSFNGTSDQISKSGFTGLSGATNLTVDAWVYPTNLTVAGTDSIFNLYNGSDDNNLISLSADTSGSAIRTYFAVGNSTGTVYYVYKDAVLSNNQWYHIAGVKDGTTLTLYVNGVAMNDVTQTFSGSQDYSGSFTGYLGSYKGSSDYFQGTIDEVRVSNTARTADQIRQAYEVGQRTHPIIIDFKAELGSGNLIADTSDTSFTIDETAYGAAAAANHLFIGDKVIIKENYDGTDYLAQGSVTAVNSSTGAVTVSSWDTGSTVPTGGFTVNAVVFKWQREYFDITGSLTTQRDAVTRLTLRLTDGSQGGNFWLDDFKSNSSYMTTPGGSTVSSTLNRYLQWRAILSSSDPAVSAALTSVTSNYSDFGSTSSYGCTINDSGKPNQAIVSWTDNSTDEDIWRIQRNDDGNGSWDGVNTTVAADSTSYTDSTTATAHTYQYRIRPETSGGQTGDWCTTSTVSYSTGNFKMQGIKMQGIKIK